MKGNLILAVITVIIITYACKKDNTGNQQPLFKQKIAGLWQLENYVDTEYVFFNSGVCQFNYINIINSIVNEKSIIKKNNQADSIIEWTGTLIQGNYEFNNNGNFTYYLEYSISHKWPKKVNTINNVTTDSSITLSYSEVKWGKWGYYKGNDDDKINKRIVLVSTAVDYCFQTDTIQIITNPGIHSTIIHHYPSYSNKIYTYANGEHSEIWDIININNHQLQIFKNINEGTSETISGFPSYNQTIKGSITQIYSRIVE